MKLKDAQMRRL
jgi:uncharacterized protein (DUF3084 family)